MQIIDEVRFLTEFIIIQTSTFPTTSKVVVLHKIIVKFVDE